ncbi:MAG: ferredoxin family protein [Planctomycetaceae bacterium]
MATSHVVTSRCHGCKYTDCVVVCPVDAFTEGKEMLYIDPESCINCEACVPECPVEAILSPDERMWSRAAEERSYIALNAEMAKKSPRITAKKEPLAGPNCRAR